MAVDLSRMEMVDDKTAEILRKKTPQERLKIAFDMWLSVRSSIEHYLKEAHPDWDEKSIRKEILRRFGHETP
jgi:hypothetical protein